MDSILASRASEDEEVQPFVSPWVELNAGLWSLFAGTTIFLGLRLWCKMTRRHGLWYDDYILIVTWMVLFANNILIVHQFATGYVLQDSSKSWDDRMHILINISSCGTLIGQAWSKTAFGVTLLRMSNRWQKWTLWFCIFTMNLWMVLKIIFQWAKVCDKKSYQNWYRLDFCIGSTFRDDFKEGGNVYNILMDFVFASFPWLITRSLEMRRIEKVGLCVTMSLGMIVAIVSAIRVSWKDDGNGRDAYYIWRNGVSQVWYSSEITGTIIVQCIPILRPLVRELHTSFTSRKVNSTVDGKSLTWGSRLSGKRTSGGMNDLDKKGADRIALSEIQEEDPDPETAMAQPGPSHCTSDGIGQEAHAPSRQGSGPFYPAQMVFDAPGSLSRASADYGVDGGAQSLLSLTSEEGQQTGLSPPPHRKLAL